MSLEEDYLYALQLQNEMDSVDIPNTSNANNTNKRKLDGDDLNATQNIAHPDWEQIDPTPDIFSLFGTFDLKFFQGKLQCVELEWSKRMYQCAGICYQRTNRLGKSIIIRLSEPLLKLRSRRDLIETLLHEMIHAYLFVLNIREGNGGHGPNFKRIMQNINRVAGTNITVYHSFHDEVAHYKTHIWRCNGICQARKPFYGWIRRSVNRAPNPNDVWWAKHHETCGGTFMKIAQPEKQTTRQNAIVETPVPNITRFFDAIKAKDNQLNKSNTKTESPTATSTSISDLNSSASVIKRNVNYSDGQKIGSTSTDLLNLTPADAIRSIWNNRYPCDSTKNDASTKQPQATTSNNTDITENESNSSWEKIDDDIEIRSVHNPVIEINDDDSTEAIPNVDSKSTDNPIKLELLKDLNDDDAIIELIDDEFDDRYKEILDLQTDTSVIDEIFGTDTLMADFSEINDAIKNDPDNHVHPAMEIVTCPICEDRVCRHELNLHLDGCNGITIKINKKKRSNKPLPFYKNHVKPSTSRSTQSKLLNASEKKILLESGYTQQQIDTLFTETKEAKAYNERIMNEMANESVNKRIKIEANTEPIQSNDSMTNESEPMQKYQCPVCNTYIFVRQMNEHLDECLTIHDRIEL